MVVANELSGSDFSSVPVISSSNLLSRFLPFVATVFVIRVRGGCLLTALTAVKAGGLSRGSCVDGVLLEALFLISFLLSAPAPQMLRASISSTPRQRAHSMMLLISLNCS